MKILVIASTVSSAVIVCILWYTDFPLGHRWSTQFITNSSYTRQHDSGKKLAVNGSDVSGPAFYLRLVNSIREDLSLSNVLDETKQKAEDVIRLGYGLRPYTTEKEEASWIENGIVFRPWRGPDATSYHPKFPSPFTAEYEVYIPFYEELFFEGRKADPKYKTENKIILWYTPSRPTPRVQELGRLRACPDFPCRITTNRKYKDRSSAMVFATQIIERTQPQRRPDQMFILQNDEPEHSDPNIVRSWFGGLYNAGWKQAFNWTMTYRVDSDFFMPFGIVRKRPIPIVNKDYKAIVAKKTNVAAWFASNCNSYSQRERYIKELQKYFEIDIYGGCGKLKCDYMADNECSKMINEKYKFYLSFESAMCPDYITEKLFHYLTMDTIVVARGTDQYYRHLPREIFLNTANFPSPKSLAERMLYLHNNDTAYIEMLKEKDKYMTITEDYPIRNPNGHVAFMAYELMSVPFCQVCQRLWNLDKYSKSIPDIHKWYKTKLCKPPIDL